MSLFHDSPFFNIDKWKWKPLSRVWFCATPWTIQSMEFSRPEYWRGQPFPSPEDLPHPRIKPRSPSLQVDSLPAEEWCQIGSLLSSPLVIPRARVPLGPISSLCVRTFIGRCWTRAFPPPAFYFFSASGVKKEWGLRSWFNMTMIFLSSNGRGSIILELPRCHGFLPIPRDSEGHAIQADWKSMGSQRAGDGWVTEQEQGSLKSLEANNL